MTREHHVVQATWKARAVFLLWFTDERDGLLTDGAGSLRVFSSAGEARRHAAGGSLTLGSDEVSRFDLDRLESWTLAPEQAALRSNSILDAWNLLTDVARSVGDQVAMARLFDREMLPVYDRLVSACNIPALGALPGVGELTDEDRRAIAAVLRHGLACFDGAIR